MYNKQTKKERKTIAKARRCYEDRWDFTEEDGPAFPIQLVPGGNQYEFCPAKVSRDDPETLMIFHTLVAIIETCTWPEEGGINDQDDLWVELVAEFAPLRRQLEFSHRLNIVSELVSSAFGSSKSTTPKIPKAPRRG